ncbi:hypothetical protein [Pontibacter sp. BAB1700]|uniref:hypothetical protein n=1 Tax=Pontibacter sp. BAB1700 TaxID=1144253 RepID=UPI00026BCDC9|nr:hypothetical protein [Pontibacter sp. BAB1700]EJF10152.1 hypothetical protein O71_10979 [Pontibacter sp. BAB1700]
MKKTEIVLGAIAVVALILNLLFVPGSSILTVISLSAISVLYMYLSFALFNGVRLRYIFKKNSYKGISTMRIIGAVLTGLALSITLIGLLFKFQDWPGATINLGVGLFGLVIALIVGAVKYSKSKSDYYTKIFKRIAVYGGLGLIMLLLPKEAWLEFRYRNHPEYVKAVKKAMAESDNQELWDKAEEERQKMNVEK